MTDLLWAVHRTARKGLFSFTHEKFRAECVAPTSWDWEREKKKLAGRGPKRWALVATLFAAGKTRGVEKSGDKTATPDPFGLLGAIEREESEIGKNEVGSVAMVRSPKSLPAIQPMAKSPKKVPSRGRSRIVRFKREENAWPSSPPRTRSRTIRFMGEENALPTQVLGLPVARTRTQTIRFKGEQDTPPLPLKSPLRSEKEGMLRKDSIHEENEGEDVEMEDGDAKTGEVESDNQDVEMGDAKEQED
ncbi:hypothetical protein FB567DRAFT_590731 [Paraphoma chrysanthemicola]|uniref:Uncharacterized protein n=1 Tax=Paraphoma chrysanthemicola TaxID=798071 RepID=A0A8K0RD05_9PLEO|nr:hypothetical protein FB567DRAFT_590731 [Paraphoma chrysanthemicola]